jgi:hypothetical protein
MQITDQLQKIFFRKIGKQHFLIPRPSEQGNGGARDSRWKLSPRRQMLPKNTRRSASTIWKRSMRNWMTSSES